MDFVTLKPQLSCATIESINTKVSKNISGYFQKIDQIVINDVSLLNYICPNYSFGFDLPTKKDKARPARKSMALDASSCGKDFR